jgi:hypothetical protein
VPDQVISHLVELFSHDYRVTEVFERGSLGTALFDVRDEVVESHHASTLG